MSGGVPVPPVEAASVILTRESKGEPDPWQCFMVRRHVRSDFAADVFVFPGGKVDPADRDAALLQSTDRGDAPQGSEVDASSLALRIAAIRELFEEAGVLLAVVDDGSPSTQIAEQERMDGRARLQRGEITLTELVRDHRWRLQLRELQPFSRWITPDTLPRRYDTHFFVARLPDGQKPLHDSIETTESLWIAPGVALRRFAEGSFPLVFATQKHLERMVGFASVGDLIESTGAADLQPVMPRIVESDGETRFLLPDDPRYYSARE